MKLEAAEDSEEEKIFGSKVKIQHFGYLSADGA